MEKKYEITNDVNGDEWFKGKTVKRIRYLRDIPAYGVKAGSLGGFIASEKNLSHSGDAVVLDDAIVQGNAIVEENAVVRDNASIEGNVSVYGNSKVEGNVTIQHNFNEKDDLYIYGNTVIRGNVKVKAVGRIYDATIEDDVEIKSGKALNSIKDSCLITKSRICGSVKILNSFIKSSEITGSASISDSRIEDSTIMPNAVSISGSLLYTCSVHNDASIENSVLEKVLVCDSSVVENSRLLNGGDIRVEGNAKLYSITMNLCHGVLFTGSAILSHATFKGVKQFVATDNAYIQGDARDSHTILFEDCSNVSFSGNASISNNDGIQVLTFTGNLISMKDDVEIIGSFEIKNNVHLSELALLQNNSKTISVIEDFTLSGDSQFKKVS